MATEIITVLSSTRKKREKRDKRMKDSYLFWKGYCLKCRKNVRHTEPMYMSFSSATCIKGHQSYGNKLKVKIL